jgi:transcription antitermination factor NusG
VIEFPYIEAMSQLPWSLVRTMRHREAEVRDQFVDAGWQTYMPIQTYWRGAARNKVRAERPCFEGYLFVTCFPAGDVTAPRSIRGIVAIRRRADGFGSIIRPSIMQRFMLADLAGALDLTREKVKPPPKVFKVGDRVRLTDGALSGFEARIIKLVSKREVIAAVELFGGDVEATCQTTDLVEVSAEAA